MKPLEARANLEQAVALLANGQVLPPSTRSWLVSALLTRLRTPGANLDQLLGLRSRKGGRLHESSRNPQRDAALIRVAESIPGNQRERANELLRRLEAGDAELIQIECSTAPIPRSTRQLERIVGRKTCAASINR